MWVPGLYDQTITTRTGKVCGGQFTNDLVPHADQVVWLLSTYHTGGQSSDVVVALQAAIWTVIDPSVYSLDVSYDGASSTLYQGYTAMVADAQTHSGNIAAVLWMTPGVGGSNLYQGLITAAPPGTPPDPVPIPTSVWLLASGLLGLVAVRRRFKKG